eukprot:1700976-Rhodomonas_salina.3
MISVPTRAVLPAVSQTQASLAHDGQWKGARRNRGRGSDGMMKTATRRGVGHHLGDVVELSGEAGGPGAEGLGSLLEDDLEVGGGDGGRDGGDAGPVLGGVQREAPDRDRLALGHIHRPERRPVPPEHQLHHPQQRPRAHRPHHRAVRDSQPPVRPHLPRRHRL